VVRKNLTLEEKGFFRSVRDSDKRIPFTKRKWVSRGGKGKPADKKKGRPSGRRIEDDRVDDFWRVRGHCLHRPYPKNFLMP